MSNPTQPNLDSVLKQNGNMPEVKHPNGNGHSRMNGYMNGSSSNGHSANGHSMNGHSMNGHSTNGNGHDIDHNNDSNDLPSPETGKRYAQIIGWGCSVPEKIVTNTDLEKIIDTSDEWIRSRTGIEQRHVVSSPQETTASLGSDAARKALAVADVHPSKVDLIICASSSPEHIFPATASIIQDSIGASNAGAFDLSAACTGFVFGMNLARGQILAGDAEYVLVVGAETLSRIVDWTDRNTCMLFGDGAGAVLIAASDVPGGIQATEMGSDGSGANALILPAGGSAMPTTLETVSNGEHYIKMDGKAVFRFATRIMAQATNRVLERAGLSIDDVDLVIPHQANVRIIQNSVMRQLKIPEEKVFVNLQKYGNTSTASIPIALCEAIEKDLVKPNANIVFVGFGGGLSWGACTVKWSVPVEKQNAGWWRNYRVRAGYQAAAARSMWRKAVRWMYGVLPTDPRDGPMPVKESQEELTMDNG